jgi:PAS domain-containing protein
VTVVNRVLRKIFGSKRDEVIGGWRKLHNEELHDLYTLPKIIRIIKLRRMKWMRHVEQMGMNRTVYRLLGESQKERDH